MIQLRHWDTDPIHVLCLSCYRPDVYLDTSCQFATILYRIMSNISTLSENMLQHHVMSLIDQGNLWAKKHSHISWPNDMSNVHQSENYMIPSSDKLKLICLTRRIYSTLSGLTPAEPAWLCGTTQKRDWKQSRLATSEMQPHMIFKSWHVVKIPTCLECLDTQNRMGLIWGC